MLHTEIRTKHTKYILPSLSPLSLAKQYYTHSYSHLHTRQRRRAARLYPQPNSVLHSSRLIDKWQHQIFVYDETSEVPFQHIRPHISGASPVN